MQMNPVVILVDLFLRAIKLAMKTPQWVVDYVIMPILCLLVFGGLLVMVAM